MILTAQETDLKTRDISATFPAQDKAFFFPKEKERFLIFAA